MFQRLPTKRHDHMGFSLPELMIAIVIISILSAIVYPTYSQHMYEVRRSDAWAALTLATVNQERWFSVNHVYTDVIDNIGGSDSPQKFYTISVEADGTSYVMTARPNSDNVQGNDTACAELTLDSLGTQSPPQCWK